MRDLQARRKASTDYKIFPPFLFFGLCRIHRLPKRKADALQEDAGKLSRNRKNRLNRFRIVSRESVVASCRRAARSLPLPIIHDLLSFCKRFPAFSDFSAQVTKTRAPICLFSYTSTHHGLHDIRGIMHYPHIIQFLRDFLCRSGESDRKRTLGRMISPQNSRTARAGICRWRRAVFPPA